jgi:Raf kinase inhibitor-like YbhB/YbcL family protein
MPTWRPALVLTVIGCGASGTHLHALPPAGGRVASITLTSRSFGVNATIPIDNTCDGKDVSPQLTWSSPPDGTKTLALLLEDPDASSYTHWLVFNIPPETTQLSEGADVEQLGAKMGSNDSPDVRYGGPCPPRGELHHYVFHVFAVDTTLTLPEGARRGAFTLALNGHLIGEGQLPGMAAR